jgi:hypothetical protein
VRVLRAAQFHELVEQLVNWGRQGEVTYVQKMRSQPVAARTVAEALADVAAAPEEPSTDTAPVPEIAGPQQEKLVELAMLLTSRRGDRVRIDGVSDPGDPDRELYETGALLPGPHAILAGPTFAEWVEA